MRVLEQRAAVDTSFLVDSPALDKESCTARVEQAKKAILSCPHTKKFWDEVQKTGSFTLSCVSANDAPFLASFM